MTLHIRLLGDLELRLDETSLAPLDSARAESLLAYLLIHRKAPQPRQRLAFLLWPDSTEEQARTNLRHVLHKLRRELPEADRFLDVAPRTLQWRVDGSFRLDVADFEEALAQAADGPDGGLRGLREAVDLYTGDLLEASYDEWLLEERERLRGSFLDALERLVSLLEERGEHEEAIRHAERLLAHDPLREQTSRSLMRLHDARGDRGRSLRVYHALTATLDSELGVEPSAVTRAAYEALLPTGDEARGGGSHAGRLSGPALVGRSTERARLTELWRTSERGYAQLVLVTGEAGIGKTRLVEEFRSWCTHRGTLSAEARSYPAEGALAYAPVAAWLRAEPLAARRGRLDRGHRSELARLLPELPEPGDLPPEPLPEDEQRQRLFDSLVRAVLAPAEPLLLVADDLHWADSETLQFVHYLLRTEPDAPLLVAATARDEALDDRHALKELRIGLRALDRIVEIELARLSRRETGVLAEQVSGRRLDELDVDHVFAETEGNPLFVVESLRAGPTEGGERGPMTPRVQAVIESRLGQLSGSARDVVGLAATVGREFTTDVLAEASDATADELVRGLDELWRHRIVRDRGPDAYDFTHDKIREVAYLGLAPAERRRTHVSIARALERLHAADPAQISGQLAVHYDRAGAAEPAVFWYQRAAEAAQQLHASVEEIRLLERGLDLVAALPPGPNRDRQELAVLTALLAPLAGVEGYGSGRLGEVQGRAFDLAHELELDADPALLRSLALASLSRSEFAKARRFGEELRSRAERDGDEVAFVESNYALGVSAFWQGELDGARRHFEEAVGGYRPEHRAKHVGWYGLDPKVVCMSRLSNTLWFLGHTEAAADTRDAALALADEIGHAPSRATALTFAAYLALELSDEEGLRRYTAMLAAWCRDHESKVFEIGTGALTGFVAVLDGAREIGLSRIREALVSAQATEPAPGLSACLVRLLLEACDVSGDFRAGLAAADLHGATPGARLFEAEIRRLRAKFLAAAGAPAAEVDAELRSALEIARRQGSTALERRVEAMLADR